MHPRLQQLIVINCDNTDDSHQQIANFLLEKNYKNKYSDILIFYYSQLTQENINFTPMNNAHIYLFAHGSEDTTQAVFDGDNQPILLNDLVHTIKPLLVNLSCENYFNSIKKPLLTMVTCYGAGHYEFSRDSLAVNFHAHLRQNGIYVDIKAWTDTIALSSLFPGKKFTIKRDDEEKSQRYAEKADNAKTIGKLLGTFQHHATYNKYTLTWDHRDIKAKL